MSFIVDYKKRNSFTSTGLVIEADKSLGFTSRERSLAMVMMQDALPGVNRFLKGSETGASAEGADDQRPETVGRDDRGVVRLALADRVVFQGIEKHTGFSPVSIPRVPEGGRLGGTLPRGVRIPGMVSGGKTGPA